MNTTDWGLVGDIGATYARFALVEPDGTLTKMRAMPCSDYATSATSWQPTSRRWRARSLRKRCWPSPPRPLGTRSHSPTTRGRSLSRSCGNAPGYHRLRVVNDLYAHAAAVRHLREKERIQVGPGTAVADAPIGVIGPGTGLGVSALVPTATGPMPVAGEGGHVTMSAANARESAVLDLVAALRPRLRRARPLRAGPRQSLRCVVRAFQSPGSLPDSSTDHRPAHWRDGRPRARGNGHVLRYAWNRCR